MPNVEVRGRYRAFTYDGTTPLDFTTYANNVSVIRRPNEISFVTLRQYIPGISTPFTSFEPGSAYVIVSRNSDANFDMGPYTRVDRLPSTLNVKSPQYYLGMDKNSITIPLSVYALSVNKPLSSVTGITYVNGVGAGQSTVSVNDIRGGFQTTFTHFLPNSGYQLRNRVPFTFFAPLQSEMGDAYATGINTAGQLGMGYQYNSYGYTQLYGNWDKVVISPASTNTHAAALSTCGTKKKLFVCGGNPRGMLGLTQVVNNTLQPVVTATQTVWQELKSIWTWDWNNNAYRDILLTENILDVEVGVYFTIIKTNVKLYGCGFMRHLGNAPTGAFNGNSYQFKDAIIPSTNVSYIPYFTSYLNRSDSLQFSSTFTTDTGTYNEILASNVNKFQARDVRWYWLDSAGRLYGQGKISDGSYLVGYSDKIPVLPIGLPTNTINSNYITTVQLYGPGDPSTRYNEQFFSDFDASATTIVALSTDNKRWLAGGYAYNGGSLSNLSTTASISLSTICFYNSNQNAYVPQNGYFLRLYAINGGYMGVLNGEIYTNGSKPTAIGANPSNLLPASTLPRLNGALGVNPDEQFRFRSLYRLSDLGQPTYNCKALYCSTQLVAMITQSNQLFLVGSNIYGKLGMPDSPTTLVYNVFTQNITDNIYNVNINDNNLVVYKTDRNPAISPTPRPTFTPTPTPTLPVKFKTQGFMVGELPQSMLEAFTQDSVRDGNNSSYGWSTNILFNEPAGRTNCNSQVFNNYSLILAYDYGANSTNPAQNVRFYRHYSNRTFESPQMEPASFGGRICNVFNGYSTGPGNNIIDSSKLCFQYFSQNFPRAEYCSTIQNNFVGYQQQIYTKMAPNSGTFQDNRNSKQRIEIDSSDIGNSAQTDFYINPANNSYHVLYHKKINPSSTFDFQYYFYYTNSYDRGNTWSTPQLVQNGYFSTNLYTAQAGPYLGQLFCSRGMPNDHLVVIDTNRQFNSNTPKPAALFSVTAGNNIYRVVCAYTDRTPLDSFDELATQTSSSNAVNFHGDIGNLKLLTDQTNSLIAMYCGADTPPSSPSNSGWPTGDGSDGGGYLGTPYTGEAPCRIYYRYRNLNSFNWSAQREIGKTFPRRGDFDYAGYPYGRGFIGRIWDACIDESDNTLCIVYTPIVDRNTTRQAKWSFCAWKLYVKKVNIYTNTTIFDELIYDITSHSTTSTVYFKTITVSNIYYDTQRSSLVVCAHTVKDNTLGDGAGVTLQRTGVNSWTYIGNGPFGGGVTTTRKLKFITQKYV